MELNANMLTLATSQRDAFNLKRVDKKNILSTFTRQEKLVIVFLCSLASVFDPGPSAPYYFLSTKIFIYFVEELANTTF